MQICKQASLIKKFKFLSSTFFPALLYVSTKDPLGLPYGAHTYGSYGVIDPHLGWGRPEHVICKQSIQTWIRQHSVNVFVYAYAYEDIRTK